MTARLFLHQCHGGSADAVVAPSCWTSNSSTSSSSGSKKRDESCSGGCNTNDDANFPTRRDSQKKRRLSKSLYRVQFNEDNNQYHHSPAENSLLLDQETKKQLWYDGHDFEHFRYSLWAHSQELLQQVSPDSAERFTNTLAAAYNNSKNKASAMNASTTTSTTATVQEHNVMAASSALTQQLAAIYTQAEDLVGLEYYILSTECQADASARKRALRGAVRMTTHSKSHTLAASSKERHLFLLSKKLSKRSQSFVQEIAAAQSEALAAALRMPQ